MPSEETSRVQTELLESLLFADAKAGNRWLDVAQRERRAIMKKQPYTA